MKILIVEDEKPTAEDIKSIVTKIIGDKSVTINIQNSLKGAELFLNERSIDLLLLDLNLHGKDGYELLKDITAQSFHTIIVSANTDKALQAFEYGVLDFIPKPYNEDRFRKAFERLNLKANNSNGGLKYLSVKKKGKINLIPIENVKYFKGANVYVEIHQYDGSVELYSKTLDNLCHLLPNSYHRIHKSYIVPIHVITSIEIHVGGKYEVVLNNGEKLPLSRNYYKTLKEILSGDLE